MPRRPHIARRWTTALTWPVGISLTAYDYMWRTTPLHRREIVLADPSSELPPRLPAGVDPTEIVSPEDGVGPLFHRRYTTHIRDSELDAEALFSELTRKLSRAVPLKMARFQKVLGEKDAVELGDEYVVRMPGPWDGPVRVVDRGPRSFRFTTLQGHLEAGQIEFSVQPTDSGMLAFTIESWTRSGDPVSNLLYSRLRLAKEVQAHMWISFLENVVRIAGGRMTGGVEILTRRVDIAP